MCNRNRVCPSTNSLRTYYLYLRQENISNPNNFNEELLNVNKNHLIFFKNLFNDIISIYYDSLSQEINLYDEAKVGIIFTKYENNLFMTYGIHCKFQNDIILISIFILLSVLWGDIILNVLADIFGRFKIIIISLILLLIGCSGIVLFEYFIFNLISDANVKLDPDKFSFSEYVQGIERMDRTQEFFSQYKILLYFSLFILFVGQNALSSNSLSLLLEYSSNDEQVNKNFLFYYSGKTLSILLFFAINYRSNYYSFLYFILGIFVFILLILSCLFLKESPRHHFEYSEYREMTNCLLSIFPKEDLKIFSNENDGKNSKLIAAEKVNYETARIKDLVKLERKEGERLTEWNKFMFLFQLNKHRSMRGSTTFICKEEIISKPFLIISHFIFSKSVQNNILIVISMFTLIKINYYIVAISYSTLSFYTRSDLYNNYIINSPHFYICMIFIASNYVFYFINKFFGYKIIYFICFSVVFILSYLGEIPLVQIPHNNLMDRNKYDYSKLNLYFISSNGDFTKGIVYAFSFFVNGVNMSLYFMLFKYTKTIYRSTFFGMTNIIDKISLIISCVNVAFLKHSFFLLSIFNFIGLIIALLINNEKEYNIVTDKKRLEVSENDSFLEQMDSHE
jgi:MFS family permease